MSSLRQVLRTHRSTTSTPDNNNVRLNDLNVVAGIELDELVGVSLTLDTVYGRSRESQDGAECQTGFGPVLLDEECERLVEETDEWDLGILPAEEDLLTFCDGVAGEGAWVASETDCADTRAIYCQS